MLNAYVELQSSLHSQCSNLGNGSIYRKLLVIELVYAVEGCEMFN